MVNFIKEIETKYNVSSITVGDIQVWPFSRKPYYSQYGELYRFDISNKDRSKSIFLKLKRLKNIFYGSENLLKKYDYIIFSDTLERRLVNG